MLFTIWGSNFFGNYIGFCWMLLLGPFFLLFLFKRSGGFMNELTGSLVDFIDLETYDIYSIVGGAFTSSSTSGSSPLNTHFPNFSSK